MTQPSNLTDRIELVNDCIIDLERQLFQCFLPEEYEAALLEQYRDLLDELDALCRLADEDTTNDGNNQQGELYMTTETTLTPLQRTMERALLVESMIQSMEFHMHSLPEDMTQEEYEDFMQEYTNLNDELDALYELSIELGYVSGEGVILPNN